MLSRDWDSLPGTASALFESGTKGLHGAIPRRPLDDFTLREPLLHLGNFNSNSVARCGTSDKDNAAIRQSADDIASDGRPQDINGENRTNRDSILGNVDRGAPVLHQNQNGLG